MKRIELVMVLGFAIAFVAGWAVGVNRHGLPVATPTPLSSPTTRSDDSHFPNFREKLGLTSEQEQRMSQIWRDARKNADGLSPQYRTINSDRDKAVIALLTSEQKSQYDQIQHDREARTAELREKIDKVMHDAEASTIEMLTPAQRPKFEEIVKQGHRHGPPSMMGGGPPFHRHHAGPETAPLRPETMPSY